MITPRHSILVAQAILHSFMVAEPDDQKAPIICKLNRTDPIGMSSMGAANVLRMQHDITDVRWIFDVEAKLQSDIVLLIYVRGSNTDEEFAQLKQRLDRRGPGCIPVLQCIDITPEEFSARSGIETYLEPAASYAERPAVSAKQVSSDYETTAEGACSEQLAA